MFGVSENEFDVVVLLAVLVLPHMEVRHGAAEDCFFARGHAIVVNCGADDESAGAVQYGLASGAPLTLLHPVIKDLLEFLFHHRFGFGDSRESSGRFRSAWGR